MHYVLMDIDGVMSPLGPMRLPHRIPARFGESSEGRSAHNNVGYDATERITASYLQDHGQTKQMQTLLTSQTCSKHTDHRIVKGE